MQNFRIIQPTPALKPFIRYYWVLQDCSYGIVTQRTLPTGCMSLVFHRGERLKVTNRGELQPRCFIGGLETGFTDVISTGNIEMIVAVFHPHTAKIFFHHPASLFRDKNISVMWIIKAYRKYRHSWNLHWTDREIFVKPIIIRKQLQYIKACRRDTTYQQFGPNKHQGSCRHFVP